MIEQKLSTQPIYTELLGKEQAYNILNLFEEIENGKYNKEEIHSFKLKNLTQPIFIRSIRADMQSFINTFIDPYLTKKDYMLNTRYVIDAGANIGYTAVLFANWWPQSTIISIEPDTENYNLTLKNTGSYNNIKVIHAGLWNKSTNLKIEAGQEDGFVVREITNTNNVPLENLSKGISIDDILKHYNLPYIDFLKLNIEGSEKEVFTENYNSWLPNIKAMLIELHDGKNAGCSKTVFNAINLYDFAVAETSPYGILFVKESTYRAWYANWYKQEIYEPNINKDRFPNFYLDKK